MPETHIDRARHWQDVWTRREPDATSWYQREPGMSLALIDASGIPRSSAFIDVGAGASPLAGRLLERGWTDITVLDIATEALERMRARLGAAAGRVRWIVADVARWKPDRRYALWHDRAVFHFLMDPEEQRAYGRTLRAGLEPNGQAIIAAFAADGPERCSGLPVQRHDAQSLVAALGGGFSLVETRRETHTTPSGASQSFLWCRLRRS